MEVETFVYSGGAVKALDDQGKVGGYLVRFTGPDDPDLAGEYFTAKTYFGAHDGHGVDAMFHHGQPLITIKDGKRTVFKAQADRIFAPVNARKDENGIWAETILNIADDYERRVFELAKKGKLGWSSGAAGHTVRRTKSGEITRWIIAEGSLTPTPAEPRNRAMSLKSFVENAKAEQEPEVLPEASDDAADTAKALQLRARAYLYLSSGGQ